MLRRNLAAVHIEITKHLSSINSCEDKASLILIQKQIDTILQQGNVLRFELTQRSSDIPQADILHLTAEIEKQTILFTIQSVTALKKQVLELLYPDKTVSSQDQNYRRFLQAVYDCADSTLSNIKENEILQEKKTPLPQISSKALNLSTIVTQHGGKYIPFNQNDDPLCGQEKKSGTDDYESDSGTCQGRVFAWRDEIISAGSCLSLPRLTVLTYLYQHGSKAISTRSSLLESWRRNYTTPTQLAPIISNLLKKIQTSCIHYIALYWQDKPIGHGIGIRQIPSTHEIELFDPNRGLFVFPNSESFATFFCWFIPKIYGDIPVSLTLRKIADQPMHARASLALNKAPLSKETILIQIILLDLLRLEQYLPVIDFAEKIVFDRIQQSLASLLPTAELKPTVERIQHKIDHLNRLYLQKAFVKELLPIRLATTKPLLTLKSNLYRDIKEDSRPDMMLQGIVNISNQLHDGSETALASPFWKRSTPANDFYEIMMNLDINDASQLTIVLTKVRAFCKMHTAEAGVASTPTYQM